MSMASTARTHYRITFLIYNLFASCFYRCFTSRFCSADCQKAAWPAHKADCKRMTAANASKALRGLVHEDHEHTCGLFSVLQVCSA